MQQRTIGPLTVSAIGLGCMNLSHAYGVPPPTGQARALLHLALDAGCTLFDTAVLYGFGANESLIGEVLSPHRSKFILASKCGMHGVGPPGQLRRVIDGRPATLRAHCEDSLRRLKTDVIDLYYLHRWDRQVPLEDSVGALADLVRQGKVRAIGLSEVSAPMLRRAHAVHPVAAVQSEYSLWTRNPEIAVLQACRELGTAFVAFSPLGRGYLSGTLRDTEALQPQDIRRAMPRFSPEHYPANLRLVDGLADLAREAGCSPAQLALAWLLHRAPEIIPIPGTTRADHLQENLAAAKLKLSPAQLARAEAIMPPGAIHGARYNSSTQAEIDTESFDGERPG